MARDSIELKNMVTNEYQIDVHGLSGHTVLLEASGYISKENRDYDRRVSYKLSVRQYKRYKSLSDNGFAGDALDGKLYYKNSMTPYTAKEAFAAIKNKMVAEKFCEEIDS